MLVFNTKESACKQRNGSHRQHQQDVLLLLVEDEAATEDLSSNEINCGIVGIGPDPKGKVGERESEASKTEVMSPEPRRPRQLTRTEEYKTQEQGWSKLRAQEPRAWGIGPGVKGPGYSKRVKARGPKPRQSSKARRAPSGPHP